jgi:hypothetical protein
MQTAAHQVQHFFRNHLSMLPVNPQGSAITLLWVVMVVVQSSDSSEELYVKGKAAFT